MLWECYILRKGYRSLNIQIEAEDKKEAENKVLNSCGNKEFSQEYCSDYSVLEIREISTK